MNLQSKSDRRSLADRAQALQHAAAGTLWGRDARRLLAADPLPGGDRHVRAQSIQPGAQRTTVAEAA